MRYKRDWPELESETSLMCSTSPSLLLIVVCLRRRLACDHEGVKPDIVTLGKALSGGTMPVSPPYTLSL